MTGFTCYLHEHPVVVECADGQRGWREHFTREHAERPAAAPSAAPGSTPAKPPPAPVTRNHPRRRLGKNRSPEYLEARARYDADHGSDAASVQR